MELRLSDGKINNRGRVVLSLGSESVGANGDASWFFWGFFFIRRPQLSLAFLTTPPPPPPPPQPEKLVSVLLKRLAWKGWRMREDESGSR